MLLSLVQTYLLLFSLVVFVVVIVHLSLVGGREGGDKRAVTELNFAHVTTITWAYFKVFGFFLEKNIVNQNSPPPPAKSLS